MALTTWYDGWVRLSWEGFGIESVIESGTRIDGTLTGVISPNTTVIDLNPQTVISYGAMDVTAGSRNVKIQCVNQSGVNAHVFHSVSIEWFLTETM